ncbi:hypothetical protein KW794_02545 [Candidatus Saccharibacteria bacterium]|nr:hypothetical protein [Candidatus Saccharibacteria bacterium]
MVTNTNPEPAPSNSRARSSILMVIILAIIVLAALATWYFTKPASKQVYSGATTVSIPSDWLEYKATKYGFVFNYPKTWSSPEVKESVLEGVKQEEITFSGNSKTTYSVVTFMTPDNAKVTSNRANIQKTLAGDKKSFLKYDGGSYSTALMDSGTKSIAQINISQIVNLPKLKISAAVTEVLLNPNSKCAGNKLAASSNDGCFSETDYTTVSQFVKTVRPL